MLCPPGSSTLAPVVQHWARVQEVADLRVTDLQFGGKPYVRLHGKGDKWRACPLWPQTSDLLKQLLDSAPTRSSMQPIFTSHRGRSLTRFGIYKIVRRHTAQLHASEVGPSQRHISPHLFRHTAAVHLLESGVDPNVIRGWLGHVSLETTNRYAEITMRAKEAALKLCEPHPAVSPAHPRTPPWQDDQKLLAWLSSL